MKIILNALLFSLVAAIDCGGENNLSIRGYENLLEIYHSSDSRARIININERLRDILL